MNFSEYEQLAARTRPSGNTGDDNLPNWALGLCGEAGEVAERVKKYLFHGHNWGSTHAALVGELGDVLWYLAAMADAIGSSLDEVAEWNIKKLRARYPDGFVSGGGKR